MFNKENINIKQFRGQGFMTIAKYDSTGELLFVADKDSKHITLISTAKNEVIGTYDGHNGVIWSLDVTIDSKHMISCSGDMSFILWDVKTGRILNRVNESGIPKYVSISQDCVIIVCDPISKRSKSYINVYSLADLLNNVSDNNIKLVEERNVRSTTANMLTGDVDVLVVTYDDGSIKKINYKTNTIVEEAKVHDESIKFVNFSKTRGEILTSSLDKRAKIIELDNLKIKKTFESTTPVNCAIYTPDQNHVILGGGIEAMMVSKSSDNDMRTKIYQISNEKLIKQITNHFGPLRYLDFNPNLNKMSFVTASQDGTAKIHYFTAITKVNIEYELFGQALVKEEKELCLNDEIIKIEEINDNEENKNKNNKNNHKNNDKMTQNEVYPMGHHLYKKEEKISEYKINSKMEVKTIERSTVKVSNLPPDVDIRDLWEMFEYYGRIEENGIRIKSFKSDTVAFINYLNLESAQKAIEKCNKRKLGCCIIGVEMAQNK